MARDRDDDALSWGDENDPTYASSHPDALAEDDLEHDIPVVDPFSSAAPAPPLPPQTGERQTAGPQTAGPQTTAPQPAATQASAPDAPESTPAPDARTAPSTPAAASGAPRRDPAQGSRVVPVLPPNAYPPVLTSVGKTPRASPTAETSTADAPQGATAEAKAAGYIDAEADGHASADADADADARAAAGARDDAHAPADADPSADADPAAEPSQLSSAALITFGILGGIYLLYTVGWLVTFIRTPVDPIGLAGIVQNAQGILAIAAPALWFIVTLLVAGRRKVSVRVVWLAIGVVVLLPWPFLTGY